METNPHRRFTKQQLPVLCTGFAILGVLIGCNNPTASRPLSAAEQALRSVKARDITSLYIPLETVTPGANVMLYLVGGPIFDESDILARKDVKGNLPPGSADTYVRVLVRQEHMIRSKEKTLPTDRFVNAEEAREINLYSVAITYALAEHFRAGGHKVSLYSNSFGSFIVPEMYRQYGDAPFERVLIAVGRLDMPKGVYESFFNGTGGGFEADGITLRARDPVAKDPLVRTQMRLQADLGRNRYTTLLADKDLSKIVYFFGGKDKAVGRLTDAEISFLTGRTVAVTASPRTPPDQTGSVSVFFPGVPADPSTTPPYPRNTRRNQNLHHQRLERGSRPRQGMVLHGGRAQRRFLAGHNQARVERLFWALGARCIRRRPGTTAQLRRVSSARADRVLQRQRPL